MMMLICCSVQNAEVHRKKGKIAGSLFLISSIKKKTGLKKRILKRVKNTTFFSTRLCVSSYLLRLKKGLKRKNFDIFK